jgi:zinc transporter 5/7
MLSLEVCALRFAKQLFAVPIALLFYLASFFKSIGSRKHLICQILANSVLFGAMLNPALRFDDRCFLFIGTKEIQHSIARSRLRLPFLLSATAMYLFTSPILFRALFSSLVLCFVSICISRACKACESEIRFDLHSLFLILIIDLISKERLRRRFILFFAILIVKPRFDFMPKLTWTSDAKRLLAFFVVNFLFMFVEFWVGVSTNSLGLISDAFHMLCDNISLLYSAITALVSQQPATARFPYGFKRIELVTTLLNGVLLMYISFNLLGESICRLIDPPLVGQDCLVLVSVLGLVVNLMGLCATGVASGDSVFLRSIFLHVMVDTMGSVAVILSSICVVKFNVFICDPICSFLIAVSIFGTAIPLIRDVVRLLMLMNPHQEIGSDLQMLGQVERWNIWKVNEESSVLTAKFKASPSLSVPGLLKLCEEKKLHDVTIEFGP